MRTGVLVPLFALLAVSGCDAYPRDTEGTLKAVEQSHMVRVGMLTDGPGGVDVERQSTPFLQSLAKATGARARVVRGAAEPLLAALDAGQLDLVIGEVATDSPWIEDAAVIEPLSTRRVGKSTLGLSPIARNGENRWIVLLEKQVRDQRGGK